MRARFWAVACVACALGCGGKLDEGGESDGSNDGLSGDSDGGADQPSDAPARGATKPGTTALGTCHPGFAPDEEPTRECDWLARGLCYKTKLEACACVCPVDRQDSVCSSGFDNGPNGKTEVKCY